MVQDLKSGATLVRYNEKQNLIPASNLKLISTLNGLKNLGPDYRFKTKIWSTGTIQNGILSGNLLVEGSGDATIYSPDREKFKENFFKKIVALLQAAGIKRIEGKIVEKNHVNLYSGIRSDWSWSDVGNYYGAGLYPININENQYSIHLSAPTQGSPAKLKKKDSLVNLDVVNVDVQTSAPGNPDLAYIYWIPGQNQVTVKGSVPQQNDLQRIKGAHMEPSAIFFQILSSELKKAGIELGEKYMAPENLQVLGQIESPPLSTIIKEINLFSNNLMTESIGFALCENGCEQNEWGWTQLAGFGVAIGCPPGYYFSDACGLSLSNRISPEGFCKALRWASNQLFYKDFYESLPVSGTSGTMKNFCKSGAAKGKIHAKSGTLNRVLCYSGYAETPTGTVAFSILINTYNGGFYAMKNQLETLMEALPGLKIN